MFTRLLTVAVAVALVGAAGPLASGSTEADGKPDCRPDTTFENDEVRIWFQSLKSHIQIEDKNTTSGKGKYAYKSRGIVELDEDGEAVRKMNLNRAFPGARSQCEITETDEFVTMNITITESVRNVRGGDAGTATVTLAYHFNKSAYGAKFDVVLVDWPWADGAEDHTLAYDFAMTAGNLVLKPADNGVGVEDKNGEKQGYVEWAGNATVTYDDESEDEANVTSSWTGNESALEIRLEFGDVDGGYVKLYYDPWMGIGDYIIVLNRLIGLAPVQQVLPAAVARTLRDAL